MVARKAFVGVSNVLYQKEKKKEGKEKTLLDLYTMRKNMCRFVRDVQNV